MTNPRSNINRMVDIPNIGKAMEKDLSLLGIVQPEDLVGKDPYLMYEDLCQKTGVKQDPCVIDVFISAVKFMEGEPAKKWWEYTAERKSHLSTEKI